MWTSVRLRWFFWSLAIIGVLVNLFHDVQIFLQNKISDETGISVTHSYQVLNELDQLLIAYHKPISPAELKLQTQSGFAKLKVLTEDDSIKSETLENIVQLEAHASQQEIISAIQSARQEEEKLLLDRVALDMLADKKAKQQFLTANFIDIFMVILLVVVFWMEIRVRRRMETILRETISQQHSTNERLRLADKTKTHMIKTTVHDLKNPLGSILGYADLIREESNSETVLKLSKVIQNISEGTLGLVNSMLQPSSLGSGQRSLQFQKINIVECLNEVIQTLMPQAKSKQQEIVLALQDENLYAEADYQKMRDVFNNLIGNAIKFSPFKGKIFVEAKKNQENIEIYIIDEGPGFSHKDKLKAFQFSQTLSARPTGGEVSSGLGLFSAKITMDLHLGKIEIQDRKSSRGACFFLQLPVHHIEKLT